MPQYLVTFHLPDKYEPSLEDEAMHRDFHAFNRQMMSAGVRIFGGGLSPASNAKSLRKRPDGEVLLTDGPYLKAHEHVSRFSILECADMDEALAWARKGAIACRAPGEVREIFQRPAPKEATER